MLKNTQEDANLAFPSYLAASITVVLPAGIADNSTITPITKLLIPQSLSTKNTVAGIAISLKKE